MDIRYDVGAGQVQHIVVALHLSLKVVEARTAEVAFRQSVALYHRSHRPVEDEDPFLN